MKKNLMIATFFLIVIQIFSVDYNAYQGKYIEKVVFKHDKNLTDKDDDITLILRTEKGTTFSIKNLNDDFNDLWDIGFFNNISADITYGDIGIIITFNFEDKFRLNKIYFDGNENMSPKKLLSKSEIAVDDKALPEYFDEYIFLEGEKKIKKYYLKKGYFNIKVSYELTKLKDYKVNVTYKIDEGQKFFISDIMISGNKAFTTKKIISELKIKKRGILSRGYYEKKKVENGLNQLREFYKKNGYISSNIVLKKVEPINNNIKLYIDIIEGEPFQIGDITIEFAKEEIPIISKKNILKKIDGYKGKPYSEVSFTELLSNIRTLYTDLGYLSAITDSKKIFNIEKSMVNIFINIVQGEQAFINTINIKPIGNEKMKTKPWVMIREMYIKEAEPFSVKKLQLTQQKLYNLNYFENIYPIYTQIPNTNKLDLIWYAKEKPTGKAQIGGGYSNEEGLIGFIELGESNLLGFGYKLNLKYEHSKYREDFNLNFTDPWFLNPWVLKKQLSFGLDIYHLSFDRYELFYKEYKNGIAFRLGRNFWKYYQVNLQIKHDEIKLMVDDEDMTSAPADVLLHLDWNVTNAIILSFIRDQRDYFFNPTKGTKFSISSTLAGNFINGGNDKWYGFGGNAHYLKIVTQGEYYLPLFWKFVLGLRAQFGAIASFSNQKLPPIYERFFIGGDYSVRGYENRSIGYTELANARENWKWQYATWGDLGRWIVVDPNTGDWVDPYTGIIIDKDTGKNAISGSGGYNYSVSNYPIGGTKLFNFNAEYKFPIMKKQFWGALFYDAGYVWSDIYRDTNGDGKLEKIYSEPFSLNNFKLAQSVGFGIRFEVPMLGVLRLDYAIGLSHPTESEVGKKFSKTKLHFTIGNVF